MSERIEPPSDSIWRKPQFLLSLVAVIVSGVAVVLAVVNL